MPVSLPPHHMTDSLILPVPHHMSDTACAACPLPLPGFVKSNFMERSAFYGKDPAEERKNFRQVGRWAGRG